MSKIDLKSIHNQHKFRSHVLLLFLCELTTEKDEEEIDELVMADECDKQKLSKWNDRLRLGFVMRRLLKGMIFKNKNMECIYFWKMI